MTLTPDEIQAAFDAADNITDPITRSDIMRAAGATGDPEKQTWRLPNWPEPLPSTTAVRVVLLTRPDLVDHFDITI